MQQLKRRHSASSETLLTESSSLNKIYSDQEPVARNVFFKNMGIILFATFVLESARGLFIASLWPTVELVGGNHAFMGYVVGLFSFGRLIMTVPVGKWADRRNEKEPLVFSCLVTILSNGLYILAFFLKSSKLLIISRFLVGIGGGTLSVCRAHISKITTTYERATYVAMIGAAQFIGFGVTPFMSAWFTVFDESGIINPETAPAFVHSLMNVVVILSIVLFFDTEAKVYHHTKLCTRKKRNDCGLTCHQENPPHDISVILEDPSAPNASSNCDDNAEQHKAPLSELEKSLEQKWEKLVFIGICIFMGLNFTSRGVMAVVETVGTPKYVELNHIHGSQAKIIQSSLFFGKLGLVGLLVFFLTVLLQRAGVQEQLMLLVAFFLMACGSAFIGLSEYLVDTDKNHFLIVALFYCGCIMIWSLSFPVKQTTLVSAFSKILGSKPQGSMMGWIGTWGSLGRIVFSSCAGVFPLLWLFSFLLFVCILCMISLFTYILHIHWFQKKKTVLLITQQ